MSNLLSNAFRGLVVAALCFNAADTCFGRDILFRRASRNYDEQGQLGVVYRKEFETRMFTHSTWLVRVYCSLDEPDMDETIEIYSNPDGSRQLEHRRASPSLSRLIRERIWHGEKFDLSKKLDAVRIGRCQVAVPAHIANEIEQLWQTMLSALPTELKESTTHTLYLNAPVFVAFARENSSVKTGTVAMAGYNTPAYRAFAGILDDLIKLCHSNGIMRDHIFAELPGKMRDLRVRLANKRS
jgi:hypothetical protein